MTPKHAEIHEYLTAKGYTHESDQEPQLYGPSQPYSVYKSSDRSHGFTVQATGHWSKFSNAGRKGLLSSSLKGLKTLKPHIEELAR